MTTRFTENERYMMMKDIIKEFAKEDTEQIPALDDVIDRLSDRQISLLMRKLAIHLDNRLETE